MGLGLGVDLGGQGLRDGMGLCLGDQGLGDGFWLGMGVDGDGVVVWSISRVVVCRERERVNVWKRGGLRSVGLLEERAWRESAGGRGVGNRFGSMGPKNFFLLFFLFFLGSIFLFFWKKEFNKKLNEMLRFRIKRFGLTP